MESQQRSSRLPHRFALTALPWRTRAVCRWFAVILLVACSDHITAPAKPPVKSGAVEGIVARIECAADVRMQLVSCASPDSATAHSVTRADRSAAPSGVSMDLILGGQHQYVTLTSSNVTYTSDVFGFDVTVQNLIPQALGTTDGTTLDPNGVRVFFSAPPATTGGSGTVDYTDPSDGTTQMVDGTATFTASNQAYYEYATLLAQNQTSSSKHWRLHVPSTVTSFTFVVYVDAAVQYPNGWIDVSPTRDTLMPNATVTPTATVRDEVGRTVTGHTLSWSSNATSVATVGSSSGLVTAVADGTALISVTDGTVNGMDTIVVHTTPPTATNDTYPQTVIGNVSINSANIPYSVTANDVGGTSISAFDGTSVHGGTVTMTTSGANMGQFTYNPPAGYTGNDSFTYTLQNAGGTSTATVTLTVANKIWFVNANAGTNGDGRLSSPFNSLGSLIAINNGVGTHPAAGDAIFLYESATNYTGPITLLANQLLIGQDATASLATITGITVSSGSAALPAMNSSNGVIAQIVGGANDVILGSSNTVQGLTLGNATTTALSGSSFGTLTVKDVAINNTSGGAMTLSTGTANMTFGSVTSTGGTNAVSLTSVAGTMNLGSGALSGASSATFNVVGGTGTLSYAGSLTQANNAALVAVSSTHTGSLTFSGTLSATNGSGLSFSAANGIYNFSNTVTLGGGDAHVDIGGSSTGTFTFSNTSVTNPSTTSPFKLASSAANVTWSAGTITTNAATGPAPVTVSSNTGGTVSMAANITATATTQTGILVSSNSGGTFTLSGASQTITTGGNAAVTLSSNTGATVNFTGGSLAITTTSGGGFTASGGGTVTVTGANNTISSSTGTALMVTTTFGVAGVTFKSISSSGAVHGIVATGTGASGGLTVTGGGASDPAVTARGRTTSKLGGGTITLGSGGTIQNSTGVGVLLSNTNNVVLRNLTVSGGGGTTVGTAGSGNDAIQALTVTGLTLDNVLVSGDTANMGLYGKNVSGLYLVHADIENNANKISSVGTQSADSTWNVRLDNLSGADSVWDSIFQHAAINAFGVYQTTLGGSATFKVNNSTFAATTTTTAFNSGLYFVHNSNVAQTLSVTNSSFSGFTASAQYGFQYTGNTSDGGGTVTLSSDTLNNNFSDMYIGFQGGSRTLTYTISSNRLRQTTTGSGNSIDMYLLAGSNSASTLTGTLSSNVVGTNSVSGATAGSGISMSAVGAGTFAGTLTSNTVKNVTGTYGFTGTATNSSRLNLKFRSNDIEASASAVNSLWGVDLEVGLQNGDTSVGCFDLGSGKLNTAWIGNAGTFGIALATIAGNPVMNLYQYSGGTDNTTNIETFLDQTAVTVNPSSSGSTLIQAGHIVGTSTACSTP